MDAKVCTKCGRQLPATLDYFAMRVASRDGLSSWCKECTRAVTKKPERYLYRRKRTCYDPEILRREHLQRCAAMYQWKMRLDPQYRLSRRAAGVLSRCLRGAEVRHRTWHRYFDFSQEAFKAHVAAQFRPGMTWANYGAWEIDHIRPISSFRYASTADKDYRQCWSLENLQPLWRIENLMKGARVA